MRLATTIRRRIKCAFEFLGCARNERIKLGTADDLAIKLRHDFFGLLQPCFLLGDIVVTREQCEIAEGAKADILAKFRGQARPDLLATLGRCNGLHRPSHGVDPAEGASGLLARDHTLFKNDSFKAAFVQRQRGR